jgi:hypothetical protein
MNFVLARINVVQPVQQLALNSPHCHHLKLLLLVGHLSSRFTWVQVLGSDLICHLVSMIQAKLLLNPKSLHELEIL